MLSLMNSTSRVMKYTFTRILTNMIISRPIKKIEDGKRFIRYLVDNQLDYHLEDDAENIYFYHDKDGKKIEEGKRVFSNWQAKRLDKRANELYHISWSSRVGGCPIGYMLDYEWIKGKLND